jgi:CheY-like chemotaxis protein
VVGVSDTGPGITEEDIGKLFRPFQQLDGSIRRRHGGSGLGLAISKSLVELHGGKMWVESRPGFGSTFFFRLPLENLPGIDEHGAIRWLNQYAPYEEHTRRPSTPAPRPLPRLVVLEDSDSLKHLLTRHLPNVEIVPVKTLDEALQELVGTPSQGLVINAPSVSETLHTLQTTALPPGAPVVVCSIPGIHEAAGALGLADYLVKPVSRTRLLASVRRFSAHGKTVLVVDDEPEVQRLFSRMLASARHGYRVLQAENGQQALEVLRQEHPDVILLDLIMPEMDGFQFLAFRRSEPAWSSIPVIGVSAQDLAGGHIVTAALGATGNGGLPVPQLLDCIRSICRLSRTSQADGNRESVKTSGN